MIDERGDGIRSDTALCVRRVDSDWRSAWDWGLEAPGPPVRSGVFGGKPSKKEPSVCLSVWSNSTLMMPVRTAEYTHTTALRPYMYYEYRQNHQLT